MFLAFHNNRPENLLIDENTIHITSAAILRQTGFEVVVGIRLSRDSKFAAAQIKSLHLVDVFGAD